MDQKYMEEFYEKCVLKEMQILLEKQTKYFQENFEDIKTIININLEKVFQEIVEYQKTIEEKIAYIKISFLYTSLYFNKPIFQIDVYNSEYFSKSLITEKFSADWLFIYWQEYQQNLQKYIETNNLKKYIRPEAKQQKSQKAVRNILISLDWFLRYIIMEADKLEHYQQIKKSEVFRISFGEYQDWQRILFIEQPQKPILLAEKDDIMRYQKVKNQIFKKSDISRLNLSNSKFENCNFEKSKLEDMQLVDCIFENCEFYNISWESIDLSGSTFRNCVFEKNMFEKVSCIKGIQMLEKFESGIDVFDLHKPTEFLDCSINDRMDFSDSNLKNVWISNDIYKKIHIKNCNIENSSLEEYLT